VAVRGSILNPLRVRIATKSLYFTQCKAQSSCAAPWYLAYGIATLRAF
jgi:hypothetical protein